MCAIAGSINLDFQNNKKPNSRSDLRGINRTADQLTRVLVCVSVDVLGQQVLYSRILDGRLWTMRLA